MHLDDALRYSEPQAGATLLAGDGIVGLLKFLKQLSLIGSRNAGLGVPHRHMKRAIVRFRLDGDFASVGELNRVADEIDEYLRQAAAVATARRQLRSDVDFERELLVGRQRLERAANGLGNVLNTVIGEFENELAGLDLREVEH